MLEKTGEKTAKTLAEALIPEAGKFKENFQDYLHKILILLF